MAGAITLNSCDVDDKKLIALLSACEKVFK